MMSLTRTNLTETVRKQYFFKLKANIDVFSALVGLQLLALLFSFNGVGSTGSSGGGISIDVKYFSVDIVLAFTFIWAFTTAITITTKPYRNHDFTFVTNRLSSSLSNILFLFTISIIGGLTTMLSGNLLKVLIYVFSDQVLYSSNTGGLKEFFMGVCLAFFYVFFISSIGYLVGSLVQVSKLFVLLFPVSIIGIMFLDASLGKEPTVLSIIQFFVMETNIIPVIGKVLLATSVLFIAAVSILNRLEVRR